jgi:hypothetical protein
MVMREQLQWYDEKADNSEWIDALAELRQRATREGHCYQHVQAITIAIDQYAEKALGNRDYFLTSRTGSVSANVGKAGVARAKQGSSHLHGGRSYDRR